MIGNGQAGQSKFNAIVTNAIENEKVFEEIMFSIAKRLAIGSEAVNDIVIDPTGCGCDFLVFLPAIFKAFGAGPVNIDMYVGTDADDDGTLWESINRDNASINTADVIVRLNPTINSDGTKLPVEFVILSDGTAATAIAGGESKEGQIFVARKDVKYMFRLTNTEAVAATGHVSLNWFEVS